MIRRLAALLLLGWALGFALFAVSFGRPVPASLRTDAVVVPTGAPGRIDRGLALLRAGSARRMLVTGVDPDVRARELAAFYRQPRSLFRCCVDLGREAVDTRSNGQETAAWVKRHRYRSVRLVTSDWHMRRAGLELRHALGEEVQLVPDPVASTPRLGLLLDEYHKYLVRRLVLLLGVSS